MCRKCTVVFFNKNNHLTDFILILLDSQATWQSHGFRLFLKASKIKGKLTSGGVMFQRVGAMAEKALLLGPVR